MPADGSGDGQHSPFKVRDTDGRTLELEERPLGCGGQGAVYRVRGTRYAVKLIDRPGQEDRLGDSLDERLRRLSWLPLEGIALTMPRLRLAPPHVGYLMDLLEDMEPIQNLCLPPETDLLTWYRNGGGLRRRLRLLASCARILARMHGRGLVYGDLSPSNVFVSADPALDHVRLIDADNIAVEASARQRIVQTPMYQAPEIYNRRSGNTPFSDVYSFAVLAYETLRADHPLLGDLIEDEDAEAAVQQGLLPWTGHSTDDRNRSDYGIDERFVLTNRLRSLFQRNFEAGLSDPAERPDAATWAAELDAAADLTVNCRRTDCGHTYAVAHAACPFCGTALPMMLPAGIWDHVPAYLAASHGEPDQFWTEQVIVLGRKDHTTVTARHAVLAPDDPAVPFLRLYWAAGDTVEIQNIGGRTARLVGAGDPHGRSLYPGATETASVHTRIHFGTDREIHRFIAFDPNSWKQGR